MSTVKNFIILSDVYKSIYFLRWRHNGRQLTLLAKDYQHAQSLAAEVLIDPPGMSIVLADSNKNVSMFSYAPLGALLIVVIALLLIVATDVESRGGQMLLCKSEFHVGYYLSRINSSLNPLCSMHVSRMVRARLQSLGASNVRYGDLMSGLDGRIRYAKYALIFSTSNESVV